MAAAPAGIPAEGDGHVANRLTSLPHQDTAPVEAHAPTQTPHA